LGKNVGKIDKLVRFAVVSLILGLVIAGKLSTGTAVTLCIISIDLLFTAILGFDQIYAAFEIRTNKHPLVIVRKKGKPTVKTASSVPILLKGGAAIFDAELPLDRECDLAVNDHKAYP
jgi:hypothetical protein